MRSMGMSVGNGCRYDDEELNEPMLWSCFGPSRDSILMYITISALVTVVGCWLRL